MRHARSLRVAISFTSACCMAAVGHAQEKVASPGPSRPQPAFSRAVEALRREAEAGIKQREQEFARLRVLPPAPLENRNVVIRPANVNRAGARFPVNMAIQRGRVPIWFAPMPADDGAHDEDALARPQLLVAPETFDFNLFGTTGDVPSARTYLETLLTRKIEVTDMMSRMTPVQKKKLLLAGRGDIKRLLDRIENERKTFENLRTDLDRCEEFLVGLRPLRAIIFRGPFDSDSLFAKTLKKMRAEENLVRREPGLEARTPGR